MKSTMTWDHGLFSVCRDISFPTGGCLEPFVAAQIEQYFTTLFTSTLIPCHQNLWVMMANMSGSNEPILSPVPAATEARTISLGGTLEVCCITRAISESRSHMTGATINAGDRINSVSIIGLTVVKRSNRASALPFLDPVDR